MRERVLRQTIGVWGGAAWLLALAPGIARAGAAAATERMVETRPGERLRVVETGRGEPVVLVPGLFGSAYSFRKVTEPLAGSGYRVLVVEPLGLGGSDKPARADYSLTAQADRLELALESLQVGRAVVVGHAVAASVAFRLAVRHPGRVKAIVSLDGGPAEGAASADFRRMMRFSFLLRFAGMGRLRKMVRSNMAERSADPRWVTDEIVEGYLGPGSRDVSGALAVYKQIAKVREPEALHPRLPELRCPVRLVMGTATRKGGITDAEIRILEEKLSSFSIDRVPAAGHFVFEEAPQAVVAAIEAMALQGGVPGRP